MKTKLFIFGIIAAIVLVGCTQKMNEKLIKEYIDEMKCYHPYSTDEDIVFANENLGLTWEAKAYGQSNGVFPIAQMNIPDGMWAGRGEWTAQVTAPLLEEGMTPEWSEMSQIVSFMSGDAKRALIKWYFIVRLNEEDKFSGVRRGETSTIGDFSIFKDTIMIPIEYEFHYNKKSEAPAGSYARIVKHQGLTDFSTDGKTVWRRVK